MTDFQTIAACLTSQAAPLHQPIACSTRMTPARWNVPSPTRSNPCNNSNMTASTDTKSISNSDLRSKCPYSCLMAAQLSSKAATTCRREGPQVASQLQWKAVKKPNVSSVILTQSAELRKHRLLITVHRRRCPRAVAFPMRSANIWIWVRMLSLLGSRAPIQCTISRHCPCQSRFHRICSRVCDMWMVRILCLLGSIKEVCTQVEVTLLIRVIASGIKARVCREMVLITWLRIGRHLLALRTASNQKVAICQQPTRSNKNKHFPASRKCAQKTTLK